MIVLFVVTFFFFKSIRVSIQSWFIGMYKVSGRVRPSCLLAAAFVLLGVFLMTSSFSISLRETVNILILVRTQISMLMSPR